MLYVRIAERADIMCLYIISDSSNGIVAHNLASADSTPCLEEWYDSVFTQSQSLSRKV
jgi:hypothetical protein